MVEDPKIRETIDRASQRDRFWAILFPIILFSLIAVGLIVWKALKDGFGAADTSDLAGVAVVLLSLPFFLLGLLALLLLVGLSIGIFKLRGLVPLAGSKLREYLAVGKHYLLLAEDASVKPIFELRGLKAKIDQIGTSLTDRFAQKGKNL